MAIKKQPSTLTYEELGYLRRVTGYLDSCCGKWALADQLEDNELIGVAQGFGRDKRTQGVVIWMGDRAMLASGWRGVLAALEREVEVRDAE